MAAQNVAKEEGLPAGFELHKAKNAWYLPPGVQSPAGRQGERSGVPEVMRCETMAPPIVPEPNADPGRFCAARGKKCRQLMAERTRYLERLEELIAEGPSKQKIWTLFRNRISHDWVWTARTAGVPMEAC